MNRFLQVFSFLAIFVLIFHSSTFAQKQNKSTKRVLSISKDTSYKPRTAIIRSAIIPGWGQITNKKYWKLPLVYGALGTTTYLFFRNIKQFNASSNAYNLAVDGNPTNDELIPQPYYSVKNQPDRIKNFRNEVRQNADYCVLLFIFFWGLNVVDAAVDAHLKMFDVSDDLSLQLKPGYSPLANTNGISLVLRIK
jgi:hypothetical protein